jgi:cellulose synthase/poly-beta-1,6-N-acetylglucosamine synthase-like glycosyltransferase
MKFIFWGAVAVIVYTYFAYPAWLWLRSRIRPWPVMRGANAASVSVALVVRNEQAVIAQKLTNLSEIGYPSEHEVVVVSDGSTDETNSILQKFETLGLVKPILSLESRGKAASLNDAIHACAGDIVVFTDARQKIENDAILKLVENFADPAIGCVSGELMLGEPGQGESGKGMGLYWRLEKQIRELESTSGSVVGATGAIYAVRRALLEPLPPGTILDDVLTPMRVVRHGQRVLFEARARAWDSPDLGSDREFRRKVRTLSGNYQLLQFAPWLLTSENPIRFEFVSHKLMRLIVPFALLALLIASFFLSGIFYRIALVAQLIFYGLSLMPLLELKRGPIARLADAASTFVVLNTAALVAFANFVRGRKLEWVR